MKPKIPRGWRRLRTGENWKPGDDIIISPVRWNNTRGAWVSKLTYIRRKKKRRAAK